MKYRTETDSLGKVEVPEDKLWASQSARSLENFKIGTEVMPLEVIHALALIKEAVADVNGKEGKLDKKKAEFIKKAARQVQEGSLDEHFPLKVLANRKWHTKQYECE